MNEDFEQLPSTSSVTNAKIVSNFSSSAAKVDAVIKNSFDALSIDTTTPSASPTDEGPVRQKNGLTQESPFSACLTRLQHCSWYWGPLSWEDAEQLLGDQPAGAFLLRDSASDRYIFSLSFRSPTKVHHIRIHWRQGVFSFGDPSLLASSDVVELVRKAIACSSEGSLHFFLHPRVGPPAREAENVFLETPLDRYRRDGDARVPPSLKHLCRFVILRRCRRDQVDELPVSDAVKTYLHNSQYFVEDL